MVTDKSVGGEMAEVVNMETRFVIIVNKPEQDSWSKLLKV